MARRTSKLTPVRRDGGLTDPRDSPAFVGVEPFSQGTPSRLVPALGATKLSTSGAAHALETHVLAQHRLALYDAGRLLDLRLNDKM